MTGRCDACKHWTQRPLSHPQAEVIGQCGKLGIEPRTGNTAAIAPYAFGRPPGIQALLTGTWFTCYFWEARHD